MTSIGAFLSEMKAEFRASRIESWEVDARLLLCAATGLKTEELVLKSELLMTESESNALSLMKARRLKREPVSRILGSRGFWKSDFKITSETLDPRPDSETLIESALRHVKHPKRILDLGTGSGCLLLSLLGEWPDVTGVGVDISSGAIKTAKENAQSFEISGRVEFIASDWTEYKPEQPFDVVISNPPYIAPGEISSLAPEVLSYDPMVALIGGEDGLSCYRSIVKLLPSLLSHSGYLFFEIGYAQAASVSEILVRADFKVLEIVQDLSGHDRCIVAGY